MAIARICWKATRGPVESRGDWIDRSHAEAQIKSLNEEWRDAGIFHWIEAPSLADLAELAERGEKLPEGEERQRIAKMLGDY